MQSSSFSKSSAACEEPVSSPGGRVAGIPGPPHSLVRQRDLQLATLRFVVTYTVDPSRELRIKTAGLHIAKLVILLRVISDSLFIYVFTLPSAPTPFSATTSANTVVANSREKHAVVS